MKFINIDIVVESCPAKIAIVMIIIKILRICNKTNDCNEISNKEIIISDNDK